jgi:nicotinate-nucleotide pyrophosphorylase (carboxylating)
MSFPSFDELSPLIARACAEDLGDPFDDVTSRLLIGEQEVGRATFVQREAGVIAGLPILAMVAARYDARLTIAAAAGATLEAVEGSYAEGRRPLAVVSGPLRSILSAERVMLNFLQRLSGVATQTRRYCEAIAGTRARIYDTRKTTPGYRLLEKYAVRCGGGENHRMGLYDGLLVKDNHIAHLPLPQLAAHLRAIVEGSRAEAPGRFIQIEVDTLEQLAEVLKVPRVDSVLLDNMPPEVMRRAVEMRDAAAGGARMPALEASGGVNLRSVRAIAESGVDRISVGALTHSVTALDIGLDME